MNTTSTSTPFSPTSYRAIGNVLKPHPRAYVMDGMPKEILGLLRDAICDDEPLSAAVAAQFDEWVRWSITPILAPGAGAPWCSAAGWSAPELQHGAPSPGQTCHVGCPEHQGSVASERSASGYHWTLRTCLSNHLGGEGSTVVFKADVTQGVYAPAYRPLDLLALPWHDRAQIAAVFGRTIITRSDVPRELLPTTLPCSAISMCMSMEEISA